MGKNRIAIASLVLVALLGLVLWKAKQREAEIVAEPDVKVTLPAFKQGDIDELTFAAPDRPTVRHAKQGTEWKLVEPIQAKSDQPAIATALGKLGELEITGVAATKKENHAKLEVDAKTGTRVTAKTGGQVVLDVWIGMYRSGNSMLRKEGEDAVAMVKGSIRFAFSKQLREWRDRGIVELATDKVQSVELSNPKGHLKFAKNGDAWTQAPGEKAIPRFDPDQVKSLVSTIATLDATDFAEDGVTAETAGVGEKAARVVVSSTTDAEPSQVVLRIGNTKSNDYYVAREGVPTLYVVSRWVAEKLLAGADQFQKPEEGKAPVGSAENPIPVEPTAITHPSMDDPEMRKKIEAALKAQGARGK